DRRVGRGICDGGCCRKGSRARIGQGVDTMSADHPVAWYAERIYHTPCRVVAQVVDVVIAACARYDPRTLLRLRLVGRCGEHPRQVISASGPVVLEAQVDV